MTIEAVKNYEWWHDAVFGNKPTRDAIPPEVLEAYLRVVRAEAYDHRTRVTIAPAPRKVNA
jgi:hypothetical protein